MARLRSAFLAMCALLASASAVLAQAAQGAVTVGLLGPAAATSDWASGFVKHMRELGYEQGRNLTLVERAPKESNAELPALAAELAAMKPDALAALGTTPALALKRATASIPIVAVSIGDPIGAHLVESLAHPGGNVTGTAIATDVWTGKRAEQIRETFPELRCALVLRNPENLSSKCRPRCGTDWRPSSASSCEGSTWRPWMSSIGRSRRLAEKIARRRCS